MYAPKDMAHQALKGRKNISITGNTFLFIKSTIIQESAKISVQYKPLVSTKVLNHYDTSSF